MNDKDCDVNLLKGNEDLYDKFKDNLVDGPNIVSHPSHENEKIKIRGKRKCKKILGFDKNALNFWTIGQEMLYDEHHQLEPYEGIIDDIFNDNLFGIIECDIRVSEKLKIF